MTAGPGTTHMRVTAARLRDAARQHRLPLVIVVIVVAGGVIFVFLFTGDNTPPPRRVREIVVNIVPPPPPPPPPPPQKLPEPKMVEQPKMVEPEIKEDKPVEQPKPDLPKDEPPPPGPLSLDAKAVGPGDIFGLGGKPGGRGLLGGGGGSRWGWYATIVQQQIEAALRANAKTRGAVMQVRVRLWADSSGRVTRVQLASSTGDAALDAALRDDVLAHLSLREAPPADMPMPIVMRIIARRPD